MKLTIDYLKQESANFDLECVFILDLNNRDIHDLDQIKECVSLDVLNLSCNQISELNCLKFLTKLQYLNLSSNQIKNLNGLESLENLRYLNLANNNIEDISEFNKLKGLVNLTQLILMDQKKPTCNPICIKNKNYKTEIQKILPKLDCIDGELFKDSNSIMRNFDQMLSQLRDNSTLNEDSIKKSKIEVESEFWAGKSSIKIESSDNSMKNLLAIRHEKEKFRGLYDQIQKSLELSNETLKNFNSNSNKS